MTEASIKSSGASSRLSAYTNSSAEARKADRDLRAQIVPALANRNYHLPGNNYLKDWIQYFCNNHPVLGMCFAHPLHPITLCQRLIVLIGSICSGLCITNAVYLWFLNYHEDGVDGEFVSIQLGGGNFTSGNTTSYYVSHVSVTNHQVFLWTVGGAIHCIFDLSVWYISACACCHVGGTMESCGGLRWIGSYVVFAVVLVSAAAASLAVLVRATLDANDNDVKLEELKSAGVYDDMIQFKDIKGASDFHFLLSWVIEVSLALFVYNPIIGTILFTGVCGCGGLLPFMGGRPREMEMAQRRRLRKSRTEETDDSDLQP